ncbi:MAG: ATP-binding protein [Candidatus Pelagadaptatus aseana]|uniref:Lon protease family protein n=1 Tax=Candidatus Pelagadaptatus aseana TaxID=3120508 RepID=UPI0039B32758
MPQERSLLALSPDHLTSYVDATSLDEKGDDDQSDDLRIIGHERAKTALDFGLAMDIDGFNIFVVGERGSGRRTLVQQMLKQHSPKHPPGYEWCYLNNFDNPHMPTALYLEPGEGKKLIERIDRFIDDLLVLFPETFDNPGYQRKKKAIDRHFTQRYEQAITQVEQEALQNSVGLYEEEGAITFTPLLDGKAIDDAQFAALGEDQRNYFYQLLAHLEEKLSEQLLELPSWKRESSEEMRKLKYETVEQAVRPLLKEISHEYPSNLGIQKYLKLVKDHIADAILDILLVDDNETADERKQREQLIALFQPNLLESRDHTRGAPVVYEQNPTFQNLFGVVDYSVSQGVLQTNYRMIRPGALHRANGGYLMLDAEKLLSQPHIWSHLKLALKTREIQIEHPLAESAPNGTFGLQPERIALDVKVVLLGTRDIYYALQEYDPEFTELFRILADFDHYLDDSPSTLNAFANLIRERGKRLDYPPISNEAIAALAVAAMRHSEHQRRLTANIQLWNELLDEACYLWRQSQDSETIDAEHVAAAISAKRARTGRMSELMLDEIKERQILISTDGQAVGQINGLTVLAVGDSSFGNPARITATAYAGKDGVTDIEREVDLGRAIHSKGVLLLTGFLGHKYGQDFQLSLSANIALEQSYGLVDGDSASLAEACALISAITRLPLDQGLAVTGSINQFGEVQSVGGINEKIEGFHRLCLERGLTGEQGVILPKTNAINLMLNQEVIEDVRSGRFHIYVVTTIDQALELLTGKDAGSHANQGYPKNSIHGLATEQLKKLARLSSE